MFGKSIEIELFLAQQCCYFEIRFLLLLFLTSKTTIVMIVTIMSTLTIVSTLTVVTIVRMKVGKGITHWEQEGKLLRSGLLLGFG